MQGNKIRSSQLADSSNSVLSILIVLFSCYTNTKFPKEILIYLLISSIFWPNRSECCVMLLHFNTIPSIVLIIHVVQKGGRQYSPAMVYILGTYHWLLSLIFSVHFRNIVSCNICTGVQIFERSAAIML